MTLKTNRTLQHRATASEVADGYRVARAGAVDRGRRGDPQRGRAGFAGRRLRCRCLPRRAVRAVEGTGGWPCGDRARSSAPRSLRIQGVREPTVRGRDCADPGAQRQVRRIRPDRPARPGRRRLPDEAGEHCLDLCTATGAHPARGHDVHQPDRARRAPIRPRHETMHGRRRRGCADQPRGPTPSSAVACERRVRHSSRAARRRVGRRASGPLDRRHLPPQAQRQTRPCRGRERSWPRLSDRGPVSGRPEADHSGFRALSGVRGRVVLPVLVVTACLYSLLGAIGFLYIANSGRDAIRERVGNVLDQLEAGLQNGTGTVSITTADGVEADAFDAGATPPDTGNDIAVRRQVTVGAQVLVLVGHASQARLNDSLRSLYRGLWIGVPLAVLLTATMAGLATSRALRPVSVITDLADAVGDGDSTKRVPVPDTDDEIEHLARTVNEMLDRIAAGRTAQRQFTSDAAHELRTPLMALQGEIELARQSPSDADAAFLQRIDSLANRLAHRVDDLVLL